MAVSYAHQFGEFIGTFFESMMKTPVKRIAEKYGMYFDSYGYREARGKDKLTWEDIHGSHHDLDYVIEEGGTEYTIGAPVAFIELAWRRYTKHSKNKVQEIEAAINPLYEKYRLKDPFKGAILSGDFTQNSLDQLIGDRFHVLYIPYSSLVDAFKRYGIDIYYDENTKEEWFASVINQLKDIQFSNNVVLENVSKKIIKDNRKSIDSFLDDLSNHFSRKIKAVRILPLHGIEREVVDVHIAIRFIENYSEAIHQSEPLKEFILWVVYDTGDEIKGEFTSKEAAISFLSRF